MKKTLVIIIIFIIIASAAVFYNTYKKTSQPDNNADVAKPSDVKEEAPANTNNQSEKAEIKGIEIQGKIMGVGEKNIYIEREGLAPETLNIDSETPIFNKSDKARSDFSIIAPGKTVKVKYDESTKNVISIVVLD